MLIERETKAGTLERGNRLEVKSFRDRESGHRYMNTHNRGLPTDWRESTRGLARGVYAYAGGQWHNVRKLDACVLAHI